MKSLSREESGVSPVIGTILLVSITVILISIIYPMVDDVSEEEVNMVIAGITHREDTEFEMVSLESPDCADPEDVLITVLFEDGSQYGEQKSGYIYEDDWRFLNDGKVNTGSRFDLQDLRKEYGENAELVFEDEVVQPQIDEVVLQIEGHEGTIDCDL